MTRYIIPLLFLVLTLTACGNGSEATNATDVGIETPAEVRTAEAGTPDAFDASFADGMTGTVFQYYLKLRTALVASDPGAARDAAQNIRAAVGSELPDIGRAASAIAASSELAAQRAAFAELSEEIKPVLERGISQGTVYEQHCPMAFDGQGANWFSDAAEIRNPYFGDKMLTCGRVVAEIK